ncbi:MAG: amidohydrolase [Clostridia bacterium]|nr:amidohydrolase [Clostridia bacterium]
MIIDAHVHLPTGDAFRSLRAKKEGLLREMERSHVDKCVVIADSWPESEIGSTEECVSLFSEGRSDNVYVVGGISPLAAFSEQFQKICRYLEQKRLVGIKLYTGHEPFYLTDERLDKVYLLAVRHQVPVLFHSGWDNSRYGDTDAAGAVAERYPDLKLVCCHCWYPAIHKCRGMIRFPNMFFDLSSVADDPAVMGSVCAEVRDLILSVPDRVVFGSDAFGCSMSRHIAFIKELRLPQEIERKVFARNAAVLYGLKPE